jgi:hypothetical protein
MEQINSNETSYWISIRIGNVKNESMRKIAVPASNAAAGALIYNAPPLLLLPSLEVNKLARCNVGSCIPGRDAPIKPNPI